MRIRPIVRKTAHSSISTKRWKATCENGFFAISVQTKDQMGVPLRAVGFRHALVIDIYYSIHWFCKRAMKALISLCEGTGWSGLRCAQLHKGRFLALRFLRILCMLEGPQREKTYLLIFAPNVDSYQLAHSRSLITVFGTSQNECAGWSESSLGAHARRYVFWHRGSAVLYVYTAYMVCALPLPPYGWNGSLPVATWYRVTPRLQRSTCEPNWFSPPSRRTARWYISGCLERKKNNIMQSHDSITTSKTLDWLQSPVPKQFFL